MESLLLVTVPNQDGNESRVTFTSLKKTLQHTDKSLWTSMDLAEVPALNHGTLDSLVSLSDDLLKTNIQVEVSTRSVSRLSSHSALISPSPHSPSPFPPLLWPIGSFMHFYSRW